MRTAFARNLLEIAKVDSSVILITGDLGYGVLDDFSSQLPDQFINAGISEQSMMSMAAGFASKGFRPFVYSIANFPTFRCLEQIRNDVCYMGNPVTIVSVGAGLGYGNLGYSHHAIEDIAIIRSLSEMQIYSPCDSNEVGYVLEKIMNENKPSYLRLGKGGEKLLDTKLLAENSKLNIIKNGKDGVIAFTGGIGSRVVEAGKLLNSDGIIPSLISVPIISDDSISELIQFSERRILMTVEEHSLRAGFGSWVLEVASSLGRQERIIRVGLKENMKSNLGTQEFLLDLNDLRPGDIAFKFKEQLVNF